MFTVPTPFVVSTNVKPYRVDTCSKCRTQYIRRNQKDTVERDWIDCPKCRKRTNTVKPIILDK